MDKYIVFDIDRKKTVACVEPTGERNRYTGPRTATYKELKVKY